MAIAVVLGWVLGCAPAPGPSSPGPAANRPAAVQFAPLPADATGVLTFQRDGNVFTLPLDSKNERKVTNFPPQTQAVFSTRSPDGARLVYIRVEGFGSTMWVSDATGGGARKLIDESASYATLERPQWTPDGSAVVYTYHGFVVENGSIKGEVIRAERLDLDSGERTPIAADAEGPTIAADGAVAFIRTTRSGQELILLDVGGTEKVLVAERSFLNIAAPRFSPDGKHVAFSAVGDGPKAGARVGPESPAARLAGPLRSLASAFQPALAFAHGEPWDIWVADVGAAVRRLSKLTEDEPTVAWAPDGRYVAVSGGTGVYVIDGSSGQTTQLQQIGGFGGIDWTR